MSRLCFLFQVLLTHSNSQWWNRLGFSPCSDLCLEINFCEILNYLSLSKREGEWVREGWDFFSVHYHRVRFQWIKSPKSSLKRTQKGFGKAADFPCGINFESSAFGSVVVVVVVAMADLMVVCIIWLPPALTLKSDSISRFKPFHRCATDCKNSISRGSLCLPKMKGPQ